MDESIVTFDYNIKFSIKHVGYFKNYIYMYKDYLINKNILNPELINNKIGIIYITYKNNVEEHLTGIIYFDFFNDYSDFINFTENIISLKINTLDVKEIKIY